MPRRRIAVGIERHRRQLQRKLHEVPGAVRATGPGVQGNRAPHGYKKSEDCQSISVAPLHAITDRLSMIPAKNSFVVKSNVMGPLRVRVIDSTRNANGFEYATTNAVVAQLLRDGVAVEKVSFPETADAFLRSFEEDGSFNCLLLVAHGEVSSPGPKATNFLAGDAILPWLLLAHARAKLTDKLIMLAVCGGYCPDTIDTFVRDGHMGLLLLASRRSVYGYEIQYTFPSVLRQLASKQSISPEALQAALGAANPNSTFEVFSGVGIASSEFGT